jgi:hypothetical protein
MAARHGEIIVCCSFTSRRAKQLQQLFRSGSGRGWVLAGYELAVHLDVRSPVGGLAVDATPLLETVESPFATVRLRQRVTKGAGSRTKGLLMAYKLLDMAQARWRRLDGAHLLPLVSAGIVFVDGVQQEGKASKPRARAA